MTALSDLDDLFAQRHSCRAYTSDQVPDDVIKQIVRTAGRSPSWCNAQPWQLVVTKGDETDRLRAAMMAQATGELEGAGSDLPWPSEYKGIYLDRRRTCGWALYEAVGIEKGDRDASTRQAMKNFEFFGAPHIAIVTSPAELGPYGALDCGGFVTAFTVAAQAAGVATIAQAAVARFSGLLHDFFDIPDDRLILCGISFGYADTDHPANQFRTERASVDDIIDWRG